MQEITLPYTAKKIGYRDFVTHGAAAAYQREFLKGTKANITDMQPVKEDLVDHFGAEEIRKLDALPEDEYAAQYAELAGKYMLSKLEMQGAGLENIEAANMALMKRMIVQVDGKDVTEDDVVRVVNDELPQQDYIEIVSVLVKMMSRPLGRKASGGESQNSSGATGSTSSPVSS